MPDADLPLVLCLSGLDPGGGAGIAADLLALADQGAHGLPLISVLTVQDSHTVHETRTVDLALLERQWRCLLADLQPAALKIGLIDAAAQAAWLARRLAELPAGLPRVLDPVLRAGGGTELSHPAGEAALLDLLPQISVLTPNLAEACRLSGCTEREAAAAALLARGCAAVLITGGDVGGAEVHNSLHQQGRPSRHWRWPREAETFHGAGCTLAAALAGRLARGEPLESAAETAQRYVQARLRRARRVGGGRRIPGRGPLS
ncbi:MAG TPA: PfkB family carbohydrate kinase [Nevskiaceae bacterium]|nr:PfkB family carbohydrate kinase [Nevskiaceae bacterium]